MKNEWIDLTHTLNSDVPTWEGKSGFALHVEADYDHLFRVNSICMRSGIGTHMDASSHMMPKGSDISSIPLSSLVGPLCVIDVSSKAHENFVLSAEDVQKNETRFGKIPKGAWVLVYTGWSKKWEKPKAYRNEDLKGIMRFPTMSKSAAALLKQRKITGLLIDTLSPDSQESHFPVHETLLSSNIWIVENVAYCKKIPKRGATLAVFPLKVQGATEAPCRVVAILNQKSAR